MNCDRKRRNRLPTDGGLDTLDANFTSPLKSPPGHDSDSSSGGGQIKIMDYFHSLVQFSFFRIECEVLGSFYRWFASAQISSDANVPASRVHASRDRAPLYQVVLVPRGHLWLLSKADDHWWVLWWTLSLVDQSLLFENVWGDEIGFCFFFSTWTGMRCKECKYKCHNDCMINVPPSCGLPRDFYDQVIRTGTGEVPLIQINFSCYFM